MGGGRWGEGGSCVACRRSVQRELLLEGSLFFCFVAYRDGDTGFSEGWRLACSLSV